MNFAARDSEVDTLYHISELLAKDEVDSIATVVATIDTLVELLDGRVGPDHGDPEIQRTLSKHIN